MFGAEILPKSERNGSKIAEHLKNGGYKNWHQVQKGGSLERQRSLKRGVVKVADTCIPLTCDCLPPPPPPRISLFDSLFTPSLETKFHRPFCNIESWWETSSAVNYLTAWHISLSSVGTSAYHQLAHQSTVGRHISVSSVGTSAYHRVAHQSIIRFFFERLQRLAIHWLISWRQRKVIPWW